jgi:hypothetical protein
MSTDEDRGKRGVSTVLGDVDVSRVTTTMVDTPNTAATPKTKKKLRGIRRAMLSRARRTVADAPHVSPLIGITVFIVACWFRLPPAPSSMVSTPCVADRVVPPGDSQTFQRTQVGDFCVKRVKI